VVFVFLLSGEGGLLSKIELASLLELIGIPPSLDSLTDRFVSLRTHVDGSSLNKLIEILGRRSSYTKAILRRISEFSLENPERDIREAVISAINSLNPKVVHLVLEAPLKRKIVDTSLVTTHNPSGRGEVYILQLLNKVIVLELVASFRKTDLKIRERSQKGYGIPLKPHLARAMINLSGCGDNSLIMDPSLTSPSIARESLLMGLRFVGIYGDEKTAKKLSLELASYGFSLGREFRLFKSSRELGSLTADSIVSLTEDWQRINSAWKYLREGGKASILAPPSPSVRHLERAVLLKSYKLKVGKKLMNLCLLEKRIG